MKAFVTAEITPQGRAILERQLTVAYGGWGATGVKLQPAELVKAAAGCDCLVVGYEAVTTEVLEALPGLRVVACTRGGVDASVDVAACTARGIPVIYTPGRNAGAVADIAFGLMLAEARHIARVSHYIRNRDWNRATWDMAGKGVKKFKGPELAYKTIGIVGFGAVGRQLANRARGFEMEIIVFDPYVEPDAVAPWEARLVGLDELMETADFVTLACVLNDQTRGLITRERINKMKPTAYFINPARGALVDEAALVDALRAGRIAGAGLDALIDEPPAHDHPLFELDNVTITPHIGGASDDIAVRHSVMVAKDIEAWLAGRRPEHVANPEVLR